MEWTDEAIAKLRTLWAEGLSTAEIGRRLNISKNAVVGKAHRLNLPGRESPIHRQQGAVTRKVRRIKRLGGKATLAPLPAVALSDSDTGGFVTPEHALAQGAPVSGPGHLSVEAPSVRKMRARPCCYPIGDPGTKGFRFCDADIARGAYCEPHAAICYVREKDCREVAA